MVRRGCTIIKLKEHNLVKKSWCLVDTVGGLKAIGDAIQARRDVELWDCGILDEVMKALVL
jgi:hypothetical protein